VDATKRGTTVMGGPWVETKRRNDRLRRAIKRAQKVTVTMIAPRMMAVRNRQMIVLKLVGVRKLGGGKCDYIGDFVRRKACGDAGLHGEVSLMPERNELGERKRSEATAEVVVIDDQLRRKRIDLRGFQSTPVQP